MDRKEQNAVNEVAWVLKDFDAATARRVLRAAARLRGWDPEAIVAPESDSRDRSPTSE